MSRYRHLPPVLLLLLPRVLIFAVTVAVAISFGRRIGWESFIRHQDAAMHAVAAYPVAAVVLFLLGYVLVAALSLPHSSLLTIVGGFLFGIALGGVLAVTGATVGASLLLLVARSRLRGWLARRSGPIVAAIRDRLQCDGFFYLLALRLLPVFPFWAVNLAALVGGIRLRTFVPATVLGILPATFVLASIGSGVGAILAEGRAPDPTMLFAPRIVLPLTALAALSLLPVLLRRRLALHG